MLMEQRQDTPDKDGFTAPAVAVAVNPLHQVGDERTPAPPSAHAIREVWGTEQVIFRTHI
jgi:hypothetical protein